MEFAKAVKDLFANDKRIHDLHCDEQQLLNEENEFCLKIATELNNIGTALYDQEEYSSARLLFGNAKEIFLGILRGRRDDSILKAANEKIVSAKERLFHIMETASNSSRGYRNTKTDRLDFYQTSASAHDEGPRCICDAFKIDVVSSPPNSMPLSPVREKIRSDSAAVIYNMGLVFHREKKFNEAMHQYQNALSVMPKTSKSLLSAAVFNNIGQIFYLLSFLDKAKNNFSKALEMTQEAAYGTTDIVHKNKVDQYTGNIMSNIGRVYFARGQDNAALNMCQDALFAREGAFGRNHVDVAVTMFNIGFIHNRKGNKELAMYMFKQFLGFVKCNNVFSLKDDAIDLAISLNHIGQIYEQCSRSLDAMDCYKIALKRGTSHIRTHKIFAIITYNIGLLHFQEDKYNETMKAFDESINLLRCLPGNNLPDIASMLYDVGLVQLEAYKMTEALATFKKSFRLQKLVFGFDHCHVAESLYQIGMIYFIMGKYSEAMKTFQKVVRIQKVALGSDDQYEVAKTLYMIGQIHHSRDEHIEALKFYKKALIIAQSSNDSEEISIPKIHAAIVNIHASLAMAAKVLQTHSSNKASVLCSSTNIECRPLLQKKSCMNVAA